jgi:methyl-accepting chemotaxis protein
MPSASMMSSREFVSRMVALSVLVSSVTLGLIAGYLYLLLRLPPAQWVGFFEITALLFVILLVVSTYSGRFFHADVVAFLKAEETAEASGELLPKAFAKLSDLPLAMFVSGIVWWPLGGLLVSSGMALRFEAFEFFPFAVMNLAATTGGFVSSVLVYLLVKRRFHELRCELARLIGDPGERQALVRYVPLSRKLVVSITGLTFLVVAFAMLFSVVGSNRKLQANTAQVQAAHLEEWAGDLVSGGEQGLVAASERAGRLGFASHLLLLDAESGQVIWGPNDLLFPDEVRAVQSSVEHGDNRAFDSPHVIAWRRLGDTGSTVVVAVQPWEAIVGNMGEIGLRFAITLMLAVFAAFLMAWQLAADMGRATRELSAATDRVAAGKLSQVEIFESEDEFGELARSFERMAGALRATVGRVVEAADRLEGTGEQTAQVSESVLQGARAQGQGVALAAESMERISDQVAGIADSAQNLNSLVEEASSSILEMGAAGGQLNDTAGVLSSKVDEVFSSIEQMVGSVKNVSSNSDALFEAAVETSSSMEEMTSAMRQVDYTASETAKLSQSVVGAAERGQEKVQQTIESIESIRRVTTSAEEVIQGLGDRANEIGSILDVIDDVADETSLLALNAAIIAAQAGEHGRAFSVVAGEIKGLANRVLSSTKEIDAQIRAVQNDSQNAIGVMAEGSRSVARGVELSKEAGASLEEITRASRDAGGRIHEIVLAVQEQTKASGHVADMMEQVKAGIEGIRSAAEEQAHGNEVIHRSSVAMRDVGQQLRSTTEEQTRGSERIRQSIDGVREAAEAITAVLRLQSSSCQDVQGFLEEVSSRSRANGESAGSMLDATRALLAQAEDLREDVREFDL